MHISYLHSIKQVQLDGKLNRESHNFLQSGMSQPPDILEELFPDALSLLSIPHPYGHPSLIESIRAHYTAGRSDLEVVTTDGASSAISYLCQAWIDSGDEIIVEHPCYEPLMAVPTFCNAQIKYLRRDRKQGWSISPEQIKEFATPQTSMIILTNLHNPSGAYLSDDDLLGIAEVALSINPKIRIVVDESYLDLVPGAKSAVQFHPCFVSISTLSKAYGMSVLRCGWIIGVKEVTDRIRDLIVLLRNVGCGFTESLAAVFMRTLPERRERSIAQSVENLSILRETFAPLIGEKLEGAIPQHGCLYFPRLLGVDDVQALTEGWQESHQLFVGSGSYFGAPGHVRLGCGERPERVNRNAHALLTALTQ